VKGGARHLGRFLSMGKAAGNKCPRKRIRGAWLIAGVQQAAPVIDPKRGQEKGGLSEEGEKTCYPDSGGTEACGGRGDR